MATHDDSIVVEVVYALPHEQVLLTVRVPAGTTVRQAVERCGLTSHYPEIDFALSAFGIFGRRTTPDTVLHSGDRIEIYRPLIADPKEARRRRAALKKSDGR